MGIITCHNIESLASSGAFQFFPPKYLTLNRIEILFPLQVEAAPDQRFSNLLLIDLLTPLVKKDPSSHPFKWFRFVLFLTGVHTQRFTHTCSQEGWREDIDNGLFSHRGVSQPRPGRQFQGVGEGSQCVSLPVFLASFFLSYLEATFREPT